MSHPSFEVVKDFDSCDLLFAFSPIADFQTLGRRLFNQFPKESYLIHLRLLLHSIRSEHFGHNDPNSKAVVCGIADDPFEYTPYWFPLSFDLKTEIKFFLEMEEKIQDKWWILVSGEAASFDWCVTRQSKTIVKYIEANDGNWVAQKLQASPFLYKGHKIMMSTFLLVRNLDPIDVFVYKYAYGIMAASPFSIEAEFLADSKVHLPFYNVEEQTVISDSSVKCILPFLKVLGHDTLMKILKAEGIDWEVLLEEIEAIVRQLVNSVKRQVSHSCLFFCFMDGLDWNFAKKSKCLSFGFSIAHCTKRNSFSSPAGSSCLCSRV